MVARSSTRERSRGQALVEFAMILPLFAAMLFGILDAGRAVWANSVLANAAREAARHASVSGAPSKAEIRAVAARFAPAGGSDLVVQVCYGMGCAGDSDAAGAVPVRGTMVTVTITSRVDLVTPALVGIRAIAMTGSSTMLVNRP